MFSKKAVKQIQIQMAEEADKKHCLTTYYEKDVIPHKHQLIVLSSYIHMLSYAVLKESSEFDYSHETLPDVTQFIDPQNSSWNKDPLIDLAIQYVLIKLYNGKGKGTQFCFNPEKNVLIYGNERIYQLFSDVIYNDKYLSVQASGYIVFPCYNYDTQAWSHSSFLDGPVSPFYSGLAVIQSDDENVEQTHYIETLDDVGEHLPLLQTFFDPIKGFPNHRIPFSSGKCPYVLPKAFDLAAYNTFREFYCLLHSNSAKFHAISNNISSGNQYISFCQELVTSAQPPWPVTTPLVWKKTYLRAGDVFIWKDSIPFRFGCFRSPGIHPAKQKSHSPLICVELDYYPYNLRTDAEIKGEATSFITGTCSSNPLRYQSFIKKTGNRFELEVVRMMTANKGYKSPFCVDNDYWKIIPNRLFYALRGLDNEKRPVKWDDYFAQQTNDRKNEEPEKEK